MSDSTVIIAPHNCSNIASLQSTRWPIQPKQVHALSDGISVIITCDGGHICRVALPMNELQCPSPRQVLFCLLF